MSMLTVARRTARSIGIPVDGLMVSSEILSLRDTAIHMLELATDLLKNHI